MTRTSAHLLVGLFMLGLFAAPGCSEQGEGDRCDWQKSGNDSSGQGRDCADGLECVQASQLLAQDGTDRCCPPSTDTFSDDRCRRRSGAAHAPGTGGTSATGGSGGSAGMAGAAAAPATTAGAAGSAGGAGVPATAGAAGTAGSAGTSGAGAGP